MDIPRTPEFIDREVLTLTREGEWLSDGELITHGATITAFGRNLKRAPDGRWWLEIGRDRKQIEVEDTAYFVKLIEGSPASGFELSLSDGSREKLRPDTLLLTPGRLTCLTQAGFEAKFLRSAYSDLLMQALSQNQGRYQLMIEGQKIELGPPLPKTIVFFDGVCGLCNFTVDFLMRIDRKHTLHFAPLQGRIASALLPSSQRLDLDTVILASAGRTDDRSTAVLRTLISVGGLWKIAAIFLLIPKFIRDTVYRAVALNRYSWFGKRETCRLPTREERGRILD
ncbi:MAG: DUF393 domain-containing protein [Bdellovibrionales bacterium]|nr:DUF393 domain-containing protein [Bdellovibrionales bacterium]